MEWTKEQRTLHTLFVERHVQGMGRRAARALGVPEDAVYFFKRGEKPFPAKKLARLKTFLERQPPRPPPRVPKPRPVFPNRREQQAVRALLVDRYVHGIGREIAHELGIEPHTVYLFKKGSRRFSKEQLAALRAILMRERPDPQAPIRELLRECLVHRYVRGSDIARMFGLHRSTISRFKDGTLPFPTDQLAELAAHLEAQRALHGGRGTSVPSNARARPPATRRRPDGAASALRETLTELAMGFAQGVLRAVFARFGSLGPAADTPA